MAGANIFNLKNADYSERGRMLEIIVDGVAKPQTVIFSGIDCFGEKYYFTEQGLRYIQDSRLIRPWQNVILNYLNKIPIILKSPQRVVRDIRYPEHYLFFDKFAVKEHYNQKRLLGVVLIKSNITVVWNFYWFEEDKKPRATEIIYQRKNRR